MTIPKNKYQREIAPGVYVDVYDVLVAFGVTNPAIAHAIKKLLCPGQRGHKSLRDDLVEARQSVDRAIELTKPKEPSAMTDDEFAWLSKAVKDTHEHP